jgi:hypothetical protein
MSDFENTFAGAPSPRVAMMQPTFLPWQGYFALVAAADVFVFLDDFQFTYRSFQHRNRAFSPQNDVRWLTVPVDRHHANSRATITTARPLRDDPLYRKLLPSLKHTYGKHPFFRDIFPNLEAWFDHEWSSLAELNMGFIEQCACWLGFSPRFVRSSSLEQHGKRSLRIASLLETTHARTYLSARGSFAYMQADGVFPLERVDTRFLAFEPQAYTQKQSSSFVPYLSILDALFQVGPDTTRALVLAGTKEFTPWDKMSAHPQLDDVEAEEAPDAL